MHKNHTEEYKNSTYLCKKDDISNYKTSVEKNKSYVQEYIYYVITRLSYV